MRNTPRRVDECTKPRSRLASLPASRTGVVRDARPPHYARNAQIADSLWQRTELIAMCMPNKEAPAGGAGEQVVVKVGDASLQLISVLLLLASSLAFLLVAERAVAALWQWYMFYGYPTKGIITLSLRTAATFTVTMAALLVSLQFVTRVSKRRAEAPGYRLAKLATLISAVAFALYWLVALSPLNEWRN